MIRPVSPSRSYQLIYDTVHKIPAGKVSTYGEVASVSGLLRQARLVGYALHNLPPGSGVPWHRVINAQGKVSLSDIDGAYERQVRLLRKEGIVFNNGVVDLARYGWRRGASRKIRIR